MSDFKNKKGLPKFIDNPFFATIFFTSVNLDSHPILHVKLNKSVLYLTLIKQSLLQQNPSSRDSKMIQHILDVHYGNRHNKHVPKRHKLTKLLHPL